MTVGPEPMMMALSHRRAGQVKAQLDVIGVAAGCLHDYAELSAARASR
jgi:outer membrane protein OmpA-like peptidoglycan-associated protein